MVTYISVGAFLKNRLIFLRVLKVFDEPLGESNTEDKEKYQLVFQKNAPDNIFIVKFKNFTSGIKMYLNYTN